MGTKNVEAAVANLPKEILETIDRIVAENEGDLQEASWFVADELDGWWTETDLALEIVRARIVAWEARLAGYASEA